MASSQPPPVPPPLLGILPVVFGGLFSSVLALASVWLIHRLCSGFNIMGWNVYLVIPLGALYVGFTAGSGYGVASWLTGLRMTCLSVLLVGLLQVGVYFGAKALEFRTNRTPDGGSQGFWTQFDSATRELRFRTADGKQESPPAGDLGYVLRAVEILGFVLGGTTVSLLLLPHPFCARCSSYMRHKDVGTLAASALSRGWFPTMSVEEHEKADAAAEAIAADSLRAILDLAQSPDSTRFLDELARIQAESKNAPIVPRRFRLRIAHCPRCHAGHFEVTLFEPSGSRERETSMGAVPLSPETVRTVTGR